MYRRIFQGLFLLVALCWAQQSSAQFFAVRTNALAPLTGGVECGIEAAVTENWTLDLSTYLNPIRTASYASQILSVQLGAKYWLYENLVGHFLSGQLTWVDYHLGRRTLRYDGAAFGLGVGYGYAWMLSTRWVLSAEVGVGIYYTRDKRYDPSVGDWDVETIYHSRRLTFAPTRLGVSFSYLF